MERLGSAIAVAVFSFVVYIVFTGSSTPYDLFTGVAVSAVVGAVFSTFTISSPSKLLDLRRYAWGILYALHYFFVDEVKAHADVIKRVLHPKMPINPGIVKIPVDVKSDYALTAVANSITNTPGTVVVYVSKDKKHLYVHWIDVKAAAPEEAKKMISEGFEFFAKRVFD